MSTDVWIETNLHDGVLHIEFNRPGVNAMTVDMVAQLQVAFKQAERDDGVRCVLLTASGSTFCAGQDLGEMQTKAGLSFREHLLKTYNPLILQIRRLEKPVLAAIQGAAVGAGLGLALACDLRIASPGARFLVGFAVIGLAPDSAVSLLLPLLIGLGRATEAAFSNTPLNADQALAWGLVNRVVPQAELPAAAAEWAKQLARGPVQALGLAKRDFNKAILPHLEAVLDYEAHNQELASRGIEHREGLRAFLEKRAPDYLSH